MKTNRITILLLLLLGFIMSVKANFRSGAIVTIYNDTLVGFIDVADELSLYNSCTFKQALNGAPVKYLPQSLLSFSLDKPRRTFVSRYIPGESIQVFVEQHVAGFVSLNSLNIPKKSIFFIEKDGVMHALPYDRQERMVDDGYTRRMRMIETTYHRDTLKMVMADQPMLFPEIDKIPSPQMKNLTELVVRYNRLLAQGSSSEFETSPKHPSIVNLLVEGKMCLYKGEDEKENTRFFIAIGQKGRLIELPYSLKDDLHLNGMVIKSHKSHTSQHKDTLKRYMADAPVLHNLIDDIRKPSEMNLRKLVLEYNSYIDEATYLHQNRLRRLPLNMLVMPGFYVVGSKDGSFQPGVQLFLGFVPSNEHIFLKTGAFVYTSNTPLTNLHYTSDEHYEYSPPATTLKVPMQIDFRLKERLLQPCLAIGYNYYFYDEIKPYHRELFPVIAPSVNVFINRRMAFRISAEFEFSNGEMISYLPRKFDNVNVFAGLQIKL